MGGYSLEKLMATIADNLVQGVCCVVFLPRSLSSLEFERIFTSFFEAEFHRKLSVSNALLSNGQTPFLRLMEHLINGGSIKYLEHLVTSEGMPDTVFITNFESCSLEEQKQWLSVLSRWASAAKSSGSRKALLVAISKIPDDIAIFPQKEVRIQYHWWPGLSALEIRLLLRQMSDQLEAEEQWRESLIPSLSGSDKDLAFYLGDVILQSTEIIIQKLKEYGLQKGWNQKDIQKALKEWKPGRLGNFFDLSNSNLQLWSNGLLTYTPEYGEEIHSSALAILERENEIIHRLWRGQASLVLPIIDYIRLKIAQILQKNYPNILNQSIKSDGAYFELGELKYAFDQIPLSSLEKTSWGGVVNLAHKIRNTLAHYRLIDLSDFQKLLRGYVHLRKESGSFGVVNH
jgi:hypothetical protein